MFFPFFHFHLSICPKSQGKPKRNKKTILWEESGVSLFQIVFLFFWFSSFFSRFFGVPSPNCPKTRRKPKKTKKTILWEESWVSPFRIVFLVYLVFLEVFAVPSPTVQKLEENQKNQKNNPVRRILGKSIQDCFFWSIWFFSRFLLSQAQLSKNSRKTKKKAKKNKPILWEESWVSPFRIGFFRFFWFPKTRGKPKITKNQSCEKNLG